jgi:hypothetical protein
MRSGLTVRAKLDAPSCPSGVKISGADIEALAASGIWQRHFYRAPATLPAPRSQPPPSWRGRPPVSIVVGAGRVAVR